MSNKVAPFAATPDSTFGRQTPNESPENGGPVEAVAAPTGPGDLRLVIEEDQESGTYIYKTVDRRSGEVVLQLPRSEVLKMGHKVEYVAGMVIRTKA